MEWSDFGKKLTKSSGILELMDDLSDQTIDTPYMLGGGNPGSIPEVDALWHQRMEQILKQGSVFEKALTQYDAPDGNLQYRESIAQLMRKQYGWNLTQDNIVITNGSQSAFFILFNLLSGQYTTKGRITNKKILLPLMPEYIGYADQGIGEDHFVAIPPKITLMGEHQFKYHIDFESIHIDDSISAICISRPTNPTGNVITDKELLHLNQLAQKHNIPLLIDNAYGSPFPNIIFTDTNPIWNDNIIMGFSLSKLGLPSARTGIIIAKPDIIKAISSVNAIMSLANTTIGQLLTSEIIKSGQIIEISKSYIKPYYKEKSKEAQHYIEKYFHDLPYRIHLSQGAIFLWLWLPNMGIDTMELYKRLKPKGVVIVPGRYFFFGSNISYAQNRHVHECIRINFAQPPSVIEEGIRIIAEEVRLMKSNA
ncbi:valine--pyruvate transaminase [Spirochaeta cellobiosiphila]|uniref:valine--pyruvate transaminase n=1 Tax=Spirochaeta cellobiosiphila TaxID=504483 RepID=UPI0004078FDE|nr:valine--pyruvate transaminase [Spirochaeta cellobiosiphila]